MKLNIRLPLASLIPKPDTFSPPSIYAQFETVMFFSTQGIIISIFYFWAIDCAKK